MSILAEVATPVKSKLADRPILVCTLQHGVYLLDLSKDEFDADDYIPFQGEPVRLAFSSQIPSHGKSFRFQT